jgi:hypothetical protein
VGSLLIFYKLDPPLLILSSILIASLLCQNFSFPLPLSLMLSHVSILLQVFVATFWWILKEALENLWCALGVFLVSPLYFCEVICFHLFLCFAFTSFYLETQAKYFAWVLLVVVLLLILR